MNMKSNGQLTRRAKAALALRVGKTTDDRGYVSCPWDNLVPGAEREMFEADLRNGDGDELRTKFCAAHSSAALAVNTFALFTVRPELLALQGQLGFDRVCFERKLETGFQRKPNLDACMEYPGGLIGIESKLLEHVSPKYGSFGEWYQPRAMPWVEDRWWKVWDEAKNGGKQHLDVAQLAKHYFGLSRLLEYGRLTSATLLYLFWEPVNFSDFPAFQKHRRETEALAAAVKGSRVTFAWQSYTELWREWAAQAELATHVEALRCRYCTTV
jgi:hypothetical protein